MTDPTPMSGAQFQRHVGTDPAKWAKAFLAAYDELMQDGPRPGRVALTASWLRDYAEACVAEAVGRETAAIGRLVPQQPTE